MSKLQKTLFSLICLFLSQILVAQSCDSLYVNFTTGTWAVEVSWAIEDVNGTVLYTETGFEDGTSYVTGLCLEAGCYQFIMYDTYGDGWQGGAAELTDINDNLLLAASLPTGFEDSSPFSLGTICGCTDTLAVNYNSQALSDNGSCVYCNENSVIIKLTTEIWASEISWDVVDADGVVLFQGDGYLNYEVYEEFLCLEDGCYTLNAYDSYGDGWQGGSFVIRDSNAVVLMQGTVPPGEFTAAFLFSVNGDCDIPGCTDMGAINFMSWANLEDGSCTYISENVALLGQWSDDNLAINGFNASYTDLIGVVINGIEYAVLGSTEGTHIIDINDPANSNQVAFIPGAYGGSGVSHRDFYFHNGYVYGVCDQGTSTLQIIDISNLPAVPTVVYDSDEIFSRSHNVFVDEQTDKLFAISASGFGLSSPLLVMDISEPTNPVLLHDLSGELPGAHDMYVENDTAYVNVPGSGLWIYDFSGIAPALIATLNDYPDQGGNHSGWLNNEENIYVFADENHGYDLKVCDVSDLTDIVVESTFNSDVDPSSIAHNLIIVDNYVYLSYYHDGLQIFDISDPQNPVKAGFYDTYLPDDHIGFKGAWGIYPLLPSGNILISDMQEGLFILGFNPGTGCAADFNGDQMINVSDLLVFLADFGCVSFCVADLNEDGATNAADLLVFLAVFGTFCE